MIVTDATDYRVRCLQRPPEHVLGKDSEGKDFIAVGEVSRDVERFSGLGPIVGEAGQILKAEFPSREWS